jgi:hypothetical protein
MIGPTRATVLGLALAATTLAVPFALTRVIAEEPAANAEAAPNTLTEQEKAAGWRLLFDGKSNEHWRNYNKQDVSDKWKFQDGVIVLTGAGGGDIITKEQFDSYELVLEFMITKGGNSGLMFHVRETDGPPYKTGPEVQIQDNAGRDPQKAGWLYQLYKPPVDEKTGQPIDATRPVGKWNQIRLVLDGPKGEIEMNGVKYASFEMWSDDWNKRVAASKFADWPDFGKAKSGHICLQDHGDKVAFRNIKIRPIKQK